MSEIGVLRDLAIVVGFSALAAFVMAQLKQPLVVGYLAAGMLIGPHVPWVPTISDSSSISFMADLGVIFVMFTAGMEFSLRRLLRVGFTAAMAALIETLSMIWLGYALGRFLGMDLLEAVFLGGLLAISSTMVVVSVLRGTGKMEEPWAQTVLGICLVEDVLTLALITVLSGLSGGGSAAGGSTFSHMIGAVFYVAGVFLVGVFAVPRVMAVLERRKNPELLHLAVLGVCFVLSLFTAQLGFSVALGAFLAGLMVSESGGLKRLTGSLQPLRDLFASVFFAAIGMLIDPGSFADHWPVILLVTAAAMIGKTLFGTIGSFLAGLPLGQALRVGAGLARLGEFTFVIAALGMERGVVDAADFSMIVSVAALTILMTQFWMRAVPAAGDRLIDRMPSFLRMFTHFYTETINTLRTALREKRVWARVRPAVLDVGLRLGLFYVFMAGLSWLAGWAASFCTRPVLFPGDLHLLIAAGIGGVAVLLFQVLIRPVERILGGLFRIVAGSRLEKGGESALAPLLITVRMVLILGGSMVVVAFASPFQYPLPGLVAVAGLLGWLVWQTRHGVTGLEEGFDVIFDRMFGRRFQEDAGMQQDIRHLVEERYAWTARFEELVLPFEPCGIHRPIRELRLRERTGCSIAAIYRDDQNIVNPGPHELLQPGDVVLLLGDDAQIHQALRLMDEMSRTPAPERPHPASAISP